ncbi:MAG: hypothetical protein E7458_03035 [Ruminococcaceae bacterium]|nr:hypothetical protein [Oscillospiraceae bacterium]
MEIRELYAALKSEPQRMERFEKDPAAVIREILSCDVTAEELDTLKNGMEKLIMKEKAEAMILGSGLFPRA